ncbi:hypothetical protein D6D20_10347 [Aureobasidium pullulans]|uniref:Uncharacterized protein n=1 Tax=Aureobasidium pullulans TaxID=5580 RepID=A0A4V4ILF7_AURPU|nr:hypothetical protein D6D20_10347 [Aureobasidium pullulans]
MSPKTNNSNKAALANMQFGSMSTGMCASVAGSSHNEFGSTRDQNTTSTGSTIPEEFIDFEENDLGDDEDDQDDEDEIDSSENDESDEFDLDDDEDDDYEINPVIERMLKIAEEKALAQNVILPQFGTTSERYSGRDIGDPSSLAYGELGSIDNRNAAFQGPRQDQGQVWIDFEEFDFGEDEEDDDNLEANSVTNRQPKLAEENTHEQDFGVSPVRQVSIIKHSKFQDNRPAYEALLIMEKPTISAAAALGIIGDNAELAISEDDAEQASDQGQTPSRELFTTQDPLALWEQIELAPWEVKHCAKAIYTMLQRIRSYKEFTSELLQKEWAMAIKEDWGPPILGSLKRAAEAEFWKNKKDEREKVLRKLCNQMSLV